MEEGREVVEEGKRQKKKTVISNSHILPLKLPATTFLFAVSAL